VTAVVVARAQDKTFGQIVGQNYRLKIRDIDASIPLKSLVEVTISKVEDWKISSDFLAVVEDGEALLDRFGANLWEAVREV